MRALDITEARRRECFSCEENGVPTMGEAPAAQKQDLFAAFEALAAGLRHRRFEG